MIRALVFFLLMATPLWALGPSEMLDDPALEARARGLDDEIRCVKCQSEAVGSSNAAWAQQARRAIREQIAAGATDQQVKDWFVARYGEFVLMEPARSGSNLLLWGAGPVMLLLAGGLGLAYIRRRADARPASETALSAEEEARLREILDD